MTDNIIDVSHFQSPVDFSKVAASGIVAVIVKATQGATWKDPAYAGYKPDALSNGLLWGSYHFGTGDDVAAQVEHYLDTANPGPTELFCLDFESNPGGSGMSLDQARQFVTLVQQRTSRYPVLYGGSVLKQSLGANADPILSNCPLWLAEYGPQAVLPPGWAAYTLWQFTQSERGINGIGGTGATDRDRFDGQDAYLMARWPFS